MDVKVKSGQSVSQLARKFHTTQAAIVEANHLANPNLIRVGQTLHIPGEGDAPAAARDSVNLAGKQAAASETAGKASATTSTKAVANKAKLSQKDVDALVRAVAAEARGESPAVWTGVAQTIINYSRSSGMSIPRLVRTSYLSSNYDGNRIFYHLPMALIPRHSDIRDAVLSAANYRSPVGSRTHFHDTSIGTPSWGSSSLRIGNMVFYRT